ncbi:MAG: hypothetical protein JOZ84_07235 [Methylobacteriaceae bacterium]|nr:hypothetical protein [Methylobacteriaceae bacterium]
MRRLSLILAFAVLPASAALADAPTLNVQATCRATPAVNLDQQATYDNCMRSENAARDRLNKTWGKMRADWRSTCLKTTTLGGIPSYVELLTCVEMREAAANGQSGAPSGSMTSGRSAVGSGSPTINSPVPGALTGATAGTRGFPSGAVSAPGNPGNSLNRGLGAGSAGTTGLSSGRSIGSGSPAMSSPSPAGTAGGAASAAGAAAGGASAGGGSAGGSSGGGH